MYKHSIDLLLEACGANGGVEVVITGPGKSRAQGKNLFLPLALIGREAQADLALPDPQVSRRHGYFQLIGGRPFVVDLYSRTGIYRDGIRAGAAWLRNDQVLQVGDYSLQFYCNGSNCDEPEPQSNPLTATTLHDHSEPDVALECIGGPTEPYLWRMNSVLALVGRRAIALGLGVSDPSVSGFHCSLLRTPSGVWIFDLLGQDGTLLNGRRIRWAQLDDRDELQVGSHRFRVLITSCGRRTDADSTSHSNGSHLRSSANGGSLVALGPTIPKPAVTQDFLVSLFDRFAAVQNQMFDQFQSAMTTMVDMFSDMQREQVGLIRSEVDRLHQITEEIHELHTELVRHASANPVCAPSPRTAKPVAPPREAAKQRPTVTETTDAVHDKPAEAPVSTATAPSFELPTQQDAADGDAWLYDKIADLQRERQSRTKRLFDFLRGK